MSAEEPVAMMWSTDAAARAEGCVPPPLVSEDEAVDSAAPCGDRCRAVDEETEDSDEESDEYDSEDESDDDDEEAASSGGLPLPLASRSFVPEGEFLGPARSASAGSTAGCMRVAAVVADPAAMSQQQQGRKEILVLYRYTRFVSVESPAGEEAVQPVRGSTRVHQLRFVVPPAGDAASSLPWAGASLAPQIYPGQFSAELQELWSALASAVRVPPRATRLQVFVDAGILRRRSDRTPERVERMRGALEGMAGDPWPAYHVGVELRLPEPVSCGTEREDEDDAEDGERPAKRRRVVGEAAGQECPICLESLEGAGLAAWPGCSKPHVFHGACLEGSLRESDMCPICRRTLSARS